MQIDTPQNIVIAGQEHPVDSFSDNVRRLVNIHTEWRRDLLKEKMAVAKTEAAIRALDAELTQLVAAELTQKSQAERENEEEKSESVE